jgi:thioredoxin reductase
VTVLTNGEAADEEDENRLAASGIALVQDRVRKVLHSGDRLTSVEMENGSVVEADAMFFNTSQIPGCDLPRLLGCEMENGCAVQSQEKQTTSMPGVFVAGDADGDVQFVVAAAAEGACAAVAINRELQDEDRAVRIFRNAPR